MRRGTTPTFTIDLGDFDVSSIDKIVVTLKQDYDAINLTNERLKVIDNAIYFTLTQEETLLFKSDRDVNIQIKIKDNGGSVFTSEIISDLVEPVLSGEVL